MIKGRFCLIQKLRYYAHIKGLVSECINPMYPLYESVKLTKTYKSSQGHAVATVNGEILPRGRK